MAALGNKEDYCVVLSIGTNRDISSMNNIPQNFHIANHVPQLAILQLADVFITHVGNNSLHEAFFWGCPMLCIPVFGDQHPNAASVEQMGAGIQIPSPFAPNPSPNLDHVTVEALKDALDNILVSQAEQIRTSCVKIRAEMLQQYKCFHSTAMGKIESFVCAEWERLQVVKADKSESPSLPTSPKGLTI
jgi:UDP-N-acetylglucosamine:LPS N-acetylglucosamine transferase